MTTDELKSVKAGDEWIYYKTWEMKDEFLEDKRGKGVDVVYVHGKPLHSVGATAEILIFLHRLPRIRASITFHEWPVQD